MNHLQLEKAFYECFYYSFNTLLKGGAEEPLYEPEGMPSENTNDVVLTSSVIWYRHDYFSSALHEVAHWCIAGKKRRTQIDYGYWYAPDGRNLQQQKAFQQVEVKPQAIEMAFSLACRRPFRVSLDNLNGEISSERDFSNKVEEQFNHYEQFGYPVRAASFLSYLKKQIQ